MMAGIDDLIPVVVIITVIIARIIKAGKQGRPFVPPPPATRSRPTPDSGTVSPGDELRQFLESLGAVPPSPPAPPPPPPVQAQTAVRVPRPAPAPPRPPVPPRVRVAAAQTAARRADHRAAPGSRAAQRRRPAPVTVAPQQPAPATPAPPRRFWNQPPPPPRPLVVDECDLGAMRKNLRKHLADPQSLRGAWILREVLGPPVALR